MSIIKRDFGSEIRHTHTIALYYRSPESLTLTWTWTLNTLLLRW